MPTPRAASLCRALLCAALLQASGSRAQELPALTRGGASVLNVTFDPGTWTLTWSCGEHVTVKSCTATFTKSNGRLGRLKILDPVCHCQFKPLALHLGVTLEVNATVNHTPVLEKLRYVNRGAEGSAAQNLTCFIHDARAMTCTWGVGPAAPRDTQYFLHIRNTTGHMLMACPAYLGDHVHTGCRLEDLTLLTQHVHVTVTGSSRTCDIMLYDITLNTKLIERLSPPWNISVACNSSHCVVTWSQPRTWSHMSFLDFRYEVDIQRQNADPGSANPKVCISSEAENRYEFPSPVPRPGHVVSVRAGDVRSARWSAWSPGVAFGSEDPGVPTLHVYLTVVTVTLLCGLGLGLACKRFIRIQELFPQIPEIKDKITDDDRVNPETLRKDLLLQTEEAD
ncbi:granulocyte-macrophage colony-stimulating factor receptor subunit alpha-like [Peromyscus maniculatus bairdii]|uniref:granulocyte-macrophage colony-stimulating factor receptor subunit alpha-like n=1 Tax=Peromyscus maniculatus bairdii TaxID=230844 RepID=UPI00042AF2B7|nr:granulocyte-macrophage colony-stimulating factor receptor subunit alpha-like [Peromyscus maniculatus bairdii]XP_015861448.1 granulocyte-macrophage colony-stimulating factor receptor subunit alpha-like [Peromyscus maniculatus bairdii]XP_042125851.1 granulocyte-macrophage colony-stimulating factor receptor subunit alpha-like [Peromyscus maniculatus bairdii]